MDIAKADKATYILAKDKYIGRTEKINFLWQLAIKHKKNTEKFCYLTEILVDLKPIELTDKIIKVLNQLTNTNSKSNLLDLMVYSANYSENVLLTSQQMKYIPKIRNLIENLLLHSKNNKIFEQVIFNYAAVMPLEQAYYSIQQAMNRTDISSKVKNNIRQMIPFIALQMEMIFSSQTLQSTILPILLPEIDQKHPDLQVKYNNMLLDRLKKLSSNKINNGIREILLSYLMKIKPKFKLIRPPTVKDNIYYNWVAAYATLKANNKLKKQEIIRDSILNAKSAAYQSILLIAADKSLLNKFSQNDILRIRNSIQSKMEGKQELYLLYRKNKQKKFNKWVFTLQRIYLSMSLSKLNEIKNSPTKTTHYDHNGSQQQ